MFDLGYDENPCIAEDKKREENCKRKKGAPSCDVTPWKLCRTAVLLRCLIYSFVFRPKPSHSLSILLLERPALRLKFFTEFASCFGFFTLFLLRHKIFRLCCASEEGALTASFRAFR